MRNVVSVFAPEYPTDARYKMTEIGIGVDLLVIGTAVILHDLKARVRAAL